MTDLPRINQEIRDKLGEPFPPEAIAQHPTKKFLSTIKAFYVAERLNDVFGIGRWNFITEIVSDNPDYVTMQGELLILDYDCHIPKQYGGHQKTGTNTEPADGYKSAVTDALSKCASYIEIGIDVFKGKVKTSSGSGNKKNQPTQNSDNFEVTNLPIPKDSKEKRAEYRKQGFGMKKVDEKWVWVKYTDGIKKAVDDQEKSKAFPPDVYEMKKELSGIKDTLTHDEVEDFGKNLDDQEWEMARVTYSAIIGRIKFDKENIEDDIPF